MILSQLESMLATGHSRGLGALYREQGALISSNGEQPTKYVADFSLALLNRTGAYYICRDILGGLPEVFSKIRYWRWFLNKQPDGLLRKLLGRLMLLELTRFSRAETLARSRCGGCGSDLPNLFFDPLYVLRAPLRDCDIVLCHDLGPLTHVDLFEPSTTRLYLQAYKKIRSVKPGMVFVSQASRSEFVARFGSDYRFLAVIPLYVRADLASEDMRPPASVVSPFLLSVGALEARKNHQRVIKAFASSGLPERGYTYVFCGPRGNAAEAVEMLAQSTPGVRYLGYLPDPEVRWLYRHAAGFVLPSLLEGFGLPALEAAQYGLVSVVGMSDAQREAAGEGAILVDPYSMEAIREGLTQLVDMEPTERQRRLALVQHHAIGLSRERFLTNWSELLSRPVPSLKY